MQQECAGQAVCNRGRYSAPPEPPHWRGLQSRAGISCPGVEVGKKQHTQHRVAQEEGPHGTPHAHRLAASQPRRIPVQRRACRQEARGHLYNRLLGNNRGTSHAVPAGGLLYCVQGGCRRPDCHGDAWGERMRVTSTRLAHSPVHAGPALLRQSQTPSAARTAPPRPRRSRARRSARRSARAPRAGARPAPGRSARSVPSMRRTRRQT